MSQQIAVIQYNAGNIHSVLSALHRLGFKGILTDNPEIIQSSDKVIFPGVGEARSTMNHLRKRDWMRSLKTWEFVWACNFFVNIQRKITQIV